MNMNLFNSIKLASPKSNTFDLTHDVKMTGQMGNLMPILALECLPGDRHNIGADVFVRLQPMVAPVMHRVDVYCHYFFCPFRIVWENWEKFITSTNPTTQPQFPFITIDGSETPEQVKFLDYMGIPPYDGQGTTAVNISAVPFAMYQKIYDEYYRDQNLVTQEPDSYTLADGSNSVTKADLTTLRRRAYEHDYFTSSLPFAQKGAAVDIPLGDVVLKTDWELGGRTPTFNDINDNTPAGVITSSGTSLSADDGGVGPFPDIAYDPDGTLTVAATEINDLRRAFRLQEWLERMAVGGSRYTEQLYAMFKVKSSDARLQRPEYITGTKAPVLISEVLNTTGETGGLPQGNMAGHGVSVGKGYNGSYFCEEHGYIIGIMSVIPKPSYMQGIPKTFLRNDPLEWYWSQFAHIGEQEVRPNEIYAYQANGNTGVFGYIPRYADYRYMPPRVAGDFRSTLLHWNLSRKFATPPTLSQEFIEVNPEETDRIFAVVDPDVDKLLINVLNRVSSRRQIPVFGTPNM